MKLTKIKSMDVNKSDEKNEVNVAKDAVVAVDLTQAGVQADIQANHEAANDALLDRKKAAEDYIKSREAAKKRYGATVAPNSPEMKVNKEDPKLETKGTVTVKPIQESKQVRNRKDLASLITEARSKGVSYRVSKSLQEGFRYVFESWDDEEEKFPNPDKHELVDTVDGVDIYHCNNCGKYAAMINGKKVKKDSVEEIKNCIAGNCDESLNEASFAKKLPLGSKEAKVYKNFNQEKKSKVKSIIQKLSSLFNMDIVDQVDNFVDSMDEGLKYGEIDKKYNNFDSEKKSKANKLLQALLSLFDTDIVDRVDKFADKQEESLNEASVFDRLIKAANSLPESCCKEGVEVNESSAFNKLMAAARGEVTESAADFNKLMKAASSLPECKKLKEGVESLEDAVKDAYDHLVSIGNEAPSVGEVLDQVSSNYAGFENICDDPEVCADNYDKVKEILARIGAQVTEGLTEALEDGDVEYKGFIIHEHQPSDLKNGIAGEYTFELNGEPTYCSFMEDCKAIIDSEVEGGNGSDSWADLYSSYIDDEHTDAELPEAEPEFDWQAEVDAVDYDRIAQDDFDESFDSNADADYEISKDRYSDADKHVAKNLQADRDIDSTSIDPALAARQKPIRVGQTDESKADFNKLMNAANQLTEEKVNESSAFQKLMAAAKGNVEEKLCEGEDDEEASDLEAPVETSEVEVPDTVAEVGTPEEATLEVDPEIDVDTIDTYEPTGAEEKATFSTIKDAGDGVMYAFKDTLKDLNGLKIKLSDLQTLLSSGSSFILDLLGLGPKEDEVEILPEVEAPITINAEQPVEITDQVNSEVASNEGDIPADLLNTSGFEEVEPIDVEEDEVNK